MNYEAEIGNQMTNFVRVIPRRDRWDPVLGGRSKPINLRGGKIYDSNSRREMPDWRIIDCSVPIRSSL